MSKVAFVYGGANTLQDDIEAAELICKPDTIVACNSAGLTYDGVLPHFCTLHTELMPEWLEERRSKGLPDPENFWTSNVKTIPDCHEGMYQHVPSWNGSSGLLCVTVALYLGYEKVILCGVPLDKNSAHFDDDAPWDDAPRYRHAWSKHKEFMLGKVKSMSGWTSLILGKPTREWINE